MGYATQKKGPLGGEAPEVSDYDVAAERDGRERGLIQEGALS
jgi:hypothetical protein